MKHLYIRQKVFKITDHYDILDEQERVVYRVDQDLKFLGNTVHVSDATGQEIFVIDKKIFAFLPEFYVYFTDGREIKLKSRLSFLRHKIDIDSAGMELYLEGNVWDHQFQVYQNRNIVGSIEKAWLSWGDTYKLTILDESQQDLIVAIMIAVDYIIDAENANSGG